MRRRRKNPGPLLPLLGVVAAVGAAAFFLLRKPARLATTTGQDFTARGDTGLDFNGNAVPLNKVGATSVAGTAIGDCLLAVQGQAGFSVGPGVPNGDNTPLRVTRVLSSTLLEAETLDPRVGAGQRFNVPAGAIVGSGDCEVGFG